MSLFLVMIECNVDHDKGGEVDYHNDNAHRNEAIMMIFIIIESIFIFFRVISSSFRSSIRLLMNYFDDFLSVNTTILIYII